MRRTRSGGGANCGADGRARDMKIDSNGKKKTKESDGVTGLHYRLIYILNTYTCNAPIDMNVPAHTLSYFRCE